jgi:uncharacterized membrane protein
MDECVIVVRIYAGLNLDFDLASWWIGYVACHIGWAWSWAWWIGLDVGQSISYNRIVLRGLINGVYSIIYGLRLLDTPDEWFTC